MKYLLLVLLLSPAILIAQENNVLKISTKVARNTKFASGWIPLDSNWRYMPGDNQDWAIPGFNDSSWQSINLIRELYDIPGVPKDGIVWFRLRFETDSTLLNQQLIMRIYQTGASEVYLDGKQIHQLGIVSAIRDSVKYYSPNTLPLSFPLEYHSMHTLAIRFAIVPNRYPIYSFDIKSNLECWVTTLDHASDDHLVRYIRIYNNRMNIGIGVATVLCILYLSLFLFFPAQKINLYFSLSNLFFALFLFNNTININYHGPSFKFEILLTTCIAISLILFLYCIYKIFNQKPGWIYYTLLVTGIISIPASFLIDAGLISICLGIVVLIDTLSICIRSLSANKTGAWIILLSAVINVIYWIFNLLSSLDIIHIPDMDSYVPLAFLINPLGLAIYLGYAFGMTSQTLRQKLVQVEQLSNEKQHLLSAQNETLERQVKERTYELNRSFENLKATQLQLIQSEKMASLGQLTAGIAHEIQNPLNFVNNFSEVNKDLLLELSNEIKKRNYNEVEALAKDVIENEEKINHHGKRADAIVKGMLQHSRKSTGIKESTNINALADEYLRHAYHGLRAKDKSFNSIIKTDFDQTIALIEVVGQDISRAILNLITNALRAVHETDKLKKQADEEYAPEVIVSTKRNKNEVTISVKDNGNGILAQYLDKIFQPFFTTKPTGQGMGLGLSLAYDIIKAHGGVIKVETKAGEGSEFIIQLTDNQSHDQNMAQLLSGPT